jgi:hypothetical protein
MKRLIFWFKRHFGILTLEECNSLNLRFSENIYGDEINHLNCRSIWRDEKGKSYRCESLEEQMFELEQQLDIPSHLRWYNKNN